jgi:hypothetical protein
LHLNANCRAKSNARMRFKHKVHKQKNKIKLKTVVTPIVTQSMKLKICKPILRSGLRVPHEEKYGNKQQDSGQNYIMERREGDAL